MQQLGTELAIASYVVSWHFLCALQLQQLFDSPEVDSATREESPAQQGCSPKGHLSALNQD